jgi:hypothetical protein
MKVFTITIVFVLFSCLKVNADCPGKSFTETYFDHYTNDTSIVFVRGIKLEDYYHGIKFKILDNFFGHILDDTITIWYCNPDQITECNRFDLQATYTEQDTLICILGNTYWWENLIRCDSCPGGIDTIHLQRPEDYTPIQCYPSMLRYCQNSVSGWIFEAFQDTTISYDYFQDIFIEKSKEYFPLLGETNTWYVSRFLDGVFNTQIINTLGDTIINGTTYKKTSHQVFLREDTLLREVFGLFPDSEDENLLYDFSLTTFQNVFLQMDDNSLNKYYVHTLGINNTLDGPRKSMYLRTALNELDEEPIWVEGVGSLGHILYSAYTPDITKKGELSCFFKDGELIYQSDKSIVAGSCILTQTSISKPVDEIEINVYPNPFCDYITISGKFENQLIIELFDISGRVIYKTFTRLDPTFVINTANLNAGLYLLRIQNSINDNLNINWKLIK